MPRALIVEDEVAARETVRKIVEREGFATLLAGSLREARECLVGEPVHLALLDLELPDGQALELLPDLSRRPGTEVVFVTGHGTVDSAVRAMKGGAADFLEKPLELTRLRAILRRVRGRLDVRGQLDRIRERVATEGRLGPLLGRSPAMQRVYDLILRVAFTPASVLISGATGTGKELVAETIHALSNRSSKPFLAVNCGALAPTLIESELFGHERGAFTGADRRHQGVFERADGGTIFLDEITEMPSELQVQLLRVLETRNVTRLGSEESFGVDVRIVAATNRDPAAAVHAGALRGDLFYRLGVLRIDLPPLSRREGDLAILARHFLDRLNGTAEAPKALSDAAMRKLERHSWPGNVRELRHVIERAHILADERIEAEHVRLGGASASEPWVQTDVGTSIRTMEKRLICATLEHLNGNKTEAAHVLGISLKTLYNRLNAYKAAGDED